MTAPRCLVAAIDADLRFGLTSRSRENGCNSVSSGTRSRPGGSLSGPPRFVLGGPENGPLVNSADRMSQVISSPLWQDLVKASS